MSFVHVHCCTFAETMSSTATNDGKYRRDAADQSFDYMFKLLIIGNSSVGKTSFLFRYADNSFTSAFVSTVGIDFKVKTVFRQDKRVKLQIWVSHTWCWHILLNWHIFCSHHSMVLLVGWVPKVLFVGVYRSLRLARSLLFFCH